MGYFPTINGCFPSKLSEPGQTNHNQPPNGAAAMCFRSFATSTKSTNRHICHWPHQSPHLTQQNSPARLAPNLRFLLRWKFSRISRIQVIVFVYKQPAWGHDSSRPASHVLSTPSAHLTRWCHLSWGFDGNHSGGVKGHAPWQAPKSARSGGA